MADSTQLSATQWPAPPLWRVILGFVMAPAVVAIGFGIWAHELIFGYGCAVSTIGAAWRLRDRSPVIVADADGIRFHPTFHRTALSWRDITWVGLSRGPHSHLVIRTRARFWALSSPFTARSVEMPCMTLGLSYRETEAVIKRLRVWQRTAKPG